MARLGVPLLDEYLEFLAGRCRPNTVLDWLTARNLTLADCRQSDLDAWITSDHASYRRETGHFIRWAKQQ
ncbi:MAG TPA: hypothetical protein VGG16_12425, partial [Streptosporangiaceae bacterium]